MLFEVLMAVFMEKHTPKSSANSSLPASQSPNDNTAGLGVPAAQGQVSLICASRVDANDLLEPRESIRVRTARCMPAQWRRRR